MMEKRLLYKNKELYVFIVEDRIVEFKYRGIGSFQISLGVFRNITRMFWEGYIQNMQENIHESEE